MKSIQILWFWHSSGRCWKYRKTSKRRVWIKRRPRINAGVLLPVVNKRRISNKRRSLINKRRSIAETQSCQSTCSHVQYIGLQTIRKIKTRAEKTRRWRRLSERLMDSVRINAGTVIYSTTLLHWLRVPERISSCLMLIDVSTIIMAPRYLAAQFNLVSNVGHRQHIRSSSSAVLDVPRTNRTTIGDRAFSVSAARAWNSLTTAVQSLEARAHSVLFVAAWKL